MPNSFAKDATKLYYQMRKTNKNYKFANALKDLSLQRKKNVSKSAKTLKNMEKRSVDTMNDATTGLVDAVSELNPMMEVMHKKKGHKGMSRRQTQRRTRHRK